MTHQPFPGSDSPGWETSRDSDDEQSNPRIPEGRSSKAGTAFGAGLDGDRGDSAAAVESAPPKRSRRGRARKKPRAHEPGPDGSGGSGGGAGGAGGPSDERAKEPRSRSSRRRRRSGAGDGTKSSLKSPSRDAAQRADPAGEAPSGAGEDAANGAPKRRRRRGSRGGRRRKSKGKAAAVEVEAIPGEEDDLPELPDEAELVDSGQPREAGTRQQRGRAERGARETGAAGSAKKGGKKRRKKGAKKAGARHADEGGGKGAGPRRSKQARRESSEPRAVRSLERDQMILVNAVDQEEKRVAVVEDGRIFELLMTVESQKTLVSDIYRGKVVNMEPAIGAAFVDFGQGRNGFLHTSDVMGVYGEDGFTLDKLLTASVDPDELDDSSAGSAVRDLDESTSKDGEGKGRRREPHRRMRQRLPITDLLRVGDYVVVQVTKDAIGDKGPTLTTYISIPGRYLVLMPSMSRTGVSRKIEDEKERRRLKRILQSLDIPAGMGVIVRTAGVGQTKTELRRDLDYLLGLWETFGRRLKSGRGPTALYQESDVAIRTLRDLFDNSRTQAVVVDDPMVYEQLIEFAKQLMPEHVDLIRMHDADRPIFHHYGIEADFERVFARRVDLPSGGSIVFDQTEALVAIDVNSGRTRTDGFDFEEIALKTNLDAVPEIARQIRLRDLGGIIVCDFIDMVRQASMREVERALRAELSDDRARSKIGRISQFGLLEMTRQRLGPGTHKKVFQACPRCRGTARVRTVPSRAAAILRRLGSALTQKGFSAVEVRAHPEVIDYLREDLYDYLRALEHRFEKELELKAVPEQTEDSVLRYLRADGREVRPGGRRKRER